MRKNVEKLLFARTISSCGDVMFSTALIWFASSKITNSGMQLGLINTFELLPALLFGIFLGAIVDRYPKRKSLLIADAFRILIILVVGILLKFDMFSIYAIYMCVFLISIFTNIYMPAQFSIISKVCQDDQIQKINGNLEVATDFAQVVGSSLSGIIYKSFGMLGVTIVNSISFVCSLFCTVTLKVQEKRDTILEKENIWKDIKNGIKHIKNSRMLMVCFAMSSATNIVFGAMILLPLLLKGFAASDSLDYGICMSVNAVGLIAGGVAVSKIILKNHYQILKVCMNIIGICTIIYACSRNYMILIVCLFVIGVANSIFNVCFITLLQNNTVQEQKGKIYSVSYFLSSILFPISSFLFGIIADVSTVTIAIVISGIIPIVANVMISEIHQDEAI